jgi:hypothetical protein
MFVQHSEMKGGQLVALKRDGPLVRVFEQTQDGKVIFGAPDDDEPDTIDGPEFFATHREATGAEIDRAVGKPAARAPAADQVKDFEALVKRAEKAAADAAKSSESAAGHAAKAKSSADAASDSAKAAAKGPPKT